MALKCIFSEDERFPKTGDSARLLNIDVIKIYDEYVEQIECLMKKLGKENSNYIEYRDLDRALWVYGHGFSDKCLKKHIGYKHI